MQQSSQRYSLEFYPSPPISYKETREAIKKTKLYLYTEVESYSFQ